MKTPTKIVHDMISNNGRYVTREEFDEMTRQEQFSEEHKGRKGKTCPTCKGTGHQDRSSGRTGRPLTCLTCMGTGLV